MSTTTVNRFFPIDFEMRMFIKLKNMRIESVKKSADGLCSVKNGNWSCPAGLCTGSVPLRSSDCPGQSAMQRSIFKSLFYLALVEFWNFVKFDRHSVNDR